MRRRTLLTTALAAPLAACSPQRAADPAASSSLPTPARPTTTATPTSAAPTPSDDTRAVDAALDRLSVPQLAGQCLAIGVVPADSPGHIASLVSGLGLGGVFLLGHWTDAAQVRAMTAAVHRAATGGIHPFIASDHEGGQVQNVRVPQVGRLPSQAEMGSWDTSRVESVVGRSARGLHTLGLSMAYSPVADVVDPTLGRQNGPVGAHDRGFGTDPATCGRHAAAVVRAHRRAGLVSTVKHFPGLGRIRSNTDFSSQGTTDTTTGVDDAFLDSFAQALAAGCEAVMVSSATYARIDPDHPAVFSRRVVTDLLRTRMGHHGLVVSDDLGAAAAVASVPAEQRARRFVAAGGDQAITADPHLARAMVSGLVDLAGSGPSGLETVRRAAGHVVSVKSDHDLVTSA